MFPLTLLLTVKSHLRSVLYVSFDLVLDFEIQLRSVLFVSFDLALNFEIPPEVSSLFFFCPSSKFQNPTRSCSPTKQLLCFLGLKLWEPTRSRLCLPNNLVLNHIIPSGQCCVSKNGSDLKIRTVIP